MTGKPEVGRPGQRPLCDPGTAPRAYSAIALRGLVGEEDAAAEQER